MTRPACLYEEGPCLCSWAFQEPPTASDNQTSRNTPKSLVEDAGSFCRLGAWLG